MLYKNKRTGIRNIYWLDPETVQRLYSAEVYTSSLYSAQNAGIRGMYNIPVESIENPIEEVRGILDNYPGAAFAAAPDVLIYSSYEGPTVRVRRDLDNEERDFMYYEVSNGTLENWVNGISDDYTPPTGILDGYEGAAFAAAPDTLIYSSYTGPTVRVRRDSDNAERDFTAEEVSNGDLVLWVGNTDIDYVPPTPPTPSTPVDPADYPDFRILVNTANAGVSNSDQFNFTGALGDYDVEVYDQTGTTLLETITGLSDAATITIAAGAGTYELRVFAAATNGFNRIRFNIGGDRLKLLEIRNWGEVVWSTMQSAFFGCTNMTSVTSSVNPDFANVTNMSSMFSAVNSLTTLDVSGFNTANVTSMGFMFNGCVSLTDIIGIENFSIPNVNNFINFLSNVTLPTSRYDALLINYNEQAPNSNLSFHGGNSKYTAGGAAEAAWTSLATTYNWTITDGGNPNGYVTTLYDQSGNNNHATQGTAANQPKIVDAGSLVVENGKAAMEFDGGINLEIETEIDVVEQSIFSVTALPNITSSTQPFRLLSALSQDFLAAGIVSFGIATSYLTNERFSWLFVDNPFTGVFGVGQTTADIPAGVYLHDFIFSNPGTSIYQNGSPLSLTATISGDFNTSKYVSNYKYVGSRGTGQYSIGKLQFLAIFASDQSANRTAIETAINNEYNIYPSTNNGYVVTLYDQSGNGINITQSNSINQPIIVDQGVLVDRVYFNGSSTYMNISAITLNQPFVFSIVVDPTISSPYTKNTIVDFGTYSVEIDDNTVLYTDAGNLLGSDTITEDKVLYTIRVNSTTTEIYRNNVLIRTGNAGINDIGSTGLLGLDTLLTNYYEGRIESIFFHNSSDITNINKYINDLLAVHGINQEPNYSVFVWDSSTPSPDAV